MALIDDLKQRRFEAQTRVRNCEEQIDTYQRSLLGWTQRVNDLDICIAALEPPAEAAPQPDQQASALEDAKRIEGASEVLTVPGAGEESRDQLCSVEGCEIHADDASEFAEEGYAHVVEPEPPAMEGVAFVDGKWTIPGPSFEELDDDGLEPGPVDEASHPMASYVPATDPKADALAKAADYYSPENVAERNRFAPFRMFKRETEET